MAIGGPPNRFIAFEIGKTPIVSSPGGTTSEAYKYRCGAGGSGFSNRPVASDGRERDGSGMVARGIK
jgi:hypothetical protein